MRYVSTRLRVPPVPLSDAILEGLAADGGLFVPERLPRANPADFVGCEGLAGVAQGVRGRHREGADLGGRGRASRDGG